MGDLDRPESSDDIYVGRGRDIDPRRPILQGDVFQNVRIPGVDDSELNLGMVLSHCCSMRAGAHLRPHLLMARVEPSAAVPLERWAEGHFGEMPLPALFSDPRHFRAVFDNVGRVQSVDLQPDGRIACLDRRGILLLQQRHVFSLTRAAIELSVLHDVSRPVLDEADLLEEWLTAFVDTHDNHVDETSRAREETAFDDFMRAAVTGGTRRLMLQDAASRSAVHRQVREQIERRKDA